MRKRFLNNDDYLRLIDDEALNQLIRSNDERLIQVEEDAEASLIEYLTDNYEIEKELNIGKYLAEYNYDITYPCHSHFYKNGKIYEAMRSINGVKKPSTKTYWEFLFNPEEEIKKQAKKYIQSGNWAPGDIVIFSNNYYGCVEYNGIDFNDIRIPGINAWEKIETREWEPNMPYEQWTVVSDNGDFYTLMTLDELDSSVNPLDSPNWGLIGEYIPDYKYKLEDTEFVVYDKNVFIPIMNPCADELKEGFNIREHDPRNSNVKKHMLRLAVYDLYKLISPSNVSAARITDYEASMQWLRDANKFRINPQIPRKLDHQNKPITKYAVATFQRDFDPNNNPWLI